MIELTIEWKKELPRRGELAEAPLLESKQGWAWGVCTDARLGDEYVMISPKRLRSGEKWSELEFVIPAVAAKMQSLSINGEVLGRLQTKNGGRYGIWCAVPSPNDWNIETAWLVVPEFYVDGIMRELGVATRQEGLDAQEEISGTAAPVQHRRTIATKPDKNIADYQGPVNKRGIPRLQDFREFLGVPRLTRKQLKSIWSSFKARVKK